MSGALQAMAADLQASLTTDLPDWQGPAAESYQAMMANNVDGHRRPQRAVGDHGGRPPRPPATWSSSPATSSAT